MNWAVQYHNLKNSLDNLLTIVTELDCLLDNYHIVERDTDSAVYVQAAIAVVSL